MHKQNHLVINGIKTTSISSDRQRSKPFPSTNKTLFSTHLAHNQQQKFILGLQFSHFMVNSAATCWVILPCIIRNNIKTSKIIMKKIAILALTAAAFVSCQQQQQQQVKPEVTEIPQVVTPLKK